MQKQNVTKFRKIDVSRKKMQVFTPRQSNETKARFKRFSKSYTSPINSTKINVSKIIGLICLSLLLIVILLIFLISRSNKKNQSSLFNFATSFTNVQRGIHYGSSILNSKYVNNKLYNDNYYDTQLLW